MVLTFSESEIFFDEPFYRRTTERKKGRTSGSESDGGWGRTESGYLSIKVISTSSQDTNELMCKNELMTVQDCTLKRDK